jgi:hypothetical protein
MTPPTRQPAPARGELVERLASLDQARRTRLIEELLARRHGAAEVGIPRLAPSGPTAPLSLAQESLWILHQLAPRSPAYNAPHAYRLSGPLDVAALQDALRGVVARHEVLRTTYPAGRDGPVQAIHPPGEVALPVVEVPPARWEATVRSLILEQYERPFDLARGPLLRPRLFRIGEDEHVLLLLVHHIVMDAWSTVVLWRDLSALYAASRGRCDAVLPDLPIQFADFAVWQREQLTGARLERLLGYWRRQLDGIQPVLLETDRPRRLAPAFRGAQHELSLTDEVTTALRAVARDSGATLPMAFLAAFQLLLWRCTERDDIAIGSVVSDRTRPELHDLVGYFVNTVVLRTDLSGAGNFREVLARGRETALAAYAHQDLPFARLVQALHPYRNAGRNPLFHVFFAVHSDQGMELEGGVGLEGVEVRRFMVPLGTAQFDLSLEVYQIRDRLHCVLEYDTDLFEPATVALLARRLEALLREVTARPDGPVERLSPCLVGPRRHGDERS